TPIFIQAALELSRPRIAKSVRAAYHAPYQSTFRRTGIGAFVQDIPLESQHPSAEALEKIVADIDGLADVPTLLLWGPSDPVFSDIYLRDLEVRFPKADVHRFVGASHLVPEDADVAGVVHEWVADLDSRGRTFGSSEVQPTTQREPAWVELERRSDDDEPAMMEMADGKLRRPISFSSLDRDVRRVAAGIAALGVTSGDRVALLVPPGIDLTVCLYACWRMGAVGVLVDAGLGPLGISRALKSASPRFLIGIPRALVAARVLGWPGRRVAVSGRDAIVRNLFRAECTLEDVRALGEGKSVPPTPA